MELARPAEPKRGLVVIGEDRGGIGQHFADQLPHLKVETRRAHAAADTATLCATKEGGHTVKGRMVLFATSILASQFLPTHLSKVSAAEQTGLASVYSHESGSKTASGQRLNAGDLTAAHRSLPMGSKVKVTNKRNGQSVVVTINDRGPFVRGRVIDVTPAAAQALGFSGLTQVTVARAE